jgi:hypothetical protein
MKKFKIIKRGFKLIITNSHFILLLNGVFFSSIFYFFIESQYENELFSKISESIYHQYPNCKINDELFFVNAMHTTYNMQFSRKIVFGNETFSSIKASYLRSADSHLMDALGACGSFSIVLARTLQVSGYQVKIAQMKVDGVFGGHMIVEAKKRNHSWVVLDPLFDIAYKDKNGSLVSFNEVKNNWNYFKLQVPSNYNLKYRYEDARFTNWDKVGIFGRVIKKGLDWLLGKENADRISLRPYFLNLYQAYLVILIILYIPLFLYTINRCYYFLKYRGPQLIAELKK